MNHGEWVRRLRSASVQRSTALAEGHVSADQYVLRITLISRLTLNQGCCHALSLSLLWKVKWAELSDGPPDVRCEPARKHSRLRRPIPDDDAGVLAPVVLHLHRDAPFGSHPGFHKYAFVANCQLAARAIR